MTNSDDLIRRGDALAASPYISQKRINAIPAVAASQTADPAVNADCRQRVTVKPLVWEESNGCHNAITGLLGSYSVVDGQWFDGEKWIECVDNDAAIAAADAHNEAAIRSTIDMRPDPRDAQTDAALVEAAERAERDLTDALKPDIPVVELLRLMSGAVLDLRAALAAVNGGDA
jgi:hypothetical protein